MENTTNQSLATTDVNKLLVAALEYAARGWPVFPVKPNGKEPLTKHGFHDAVIKPEQIKAWWEKYPNANIGIPTGELSGFFVLDVDSYKGDLDSLGELTKQNGPLPKTVEAKTGGGGHHILFKYPGYRIPSSTEKIGAGLDIRGDGGYIVVEPSAHPSGSYYGWDVEHDPDEVEIAEASPWLLSLVLKRSFRNNDDSSDESYPKFEINWSAKIPIDSWNDFFLRLAIAAKRSGLDGDATLEKFKYLRDREQDLKKWPAFGDHELETIVHSAFTHDYHISLRDSTVAPFINTNKEGKKGSSNLDFLADVEPWTEPVDGQELYRGIRDIISRYMVISDYGITAITLWICFAHGLKFFEVNPRLIITSPDKRCGKSRLQDILQELVPRALRASNISAAVLYRSIDRFQPSLLIDEADSFMKENEELRGILNSGHTPKQAFVLRLVGDHHEPRRFSTWAPIIVAGIKRLWDTLMDRSIVVPLKRKTPKDKIERLFLKKLSKECLPLCRKAARWVQDNADKFGIPDAPESLNDRAADNWSPLLAIADLIGVSDEARRAAIKLSGGEAIDDSVGARLLSDLRNLFEHEDKWATNDLIIALEKIDESPWGDWKGGKPISAQQLAKLLKPFDIVPRQIWKDGEKNKRGYEKDQFQEAFTRYLPPVDIPDAREARTPENTGQTGDSESARFSATSGPINDCKGSIGAGSSGSSGAKEGQEGLTLIKWGSWDDQGNKCGEGV